MKEWLQNLKVGDKVVVDPGSGLRRRIATVQRITKTLIITKTNERFRRTDGSSPGSGGWYPDRLREPTPELITEICIEQHARKFKDMDWKSIPLEVLDKIAKLIQEVQTG